MSLGRGMFGLIVTPGEVVPLGLSSDVRITNIAFGEEITGKGRSVVKVHRARHIDDISDYDDSDSDEDDDEEGEEEGEEEAEAEAEAKANGKEKAKPAKNNGKAEEEGADDGSEGSDDDDDEDDEYIEDEYVVCSLYPERTEQAIVDLEFSSLEEIGFSVTGENAVELVGYYIDSDPYDDEPDSDELDSEDDDEYDSDELAMFNEIEGGGDSDEDMDEGEARIQEILDKAAEKAVEKAANSAKNDKKRAKAEDSDEEVEAVKESVEELSKNQKKKLNKKLKTEVQQEKVEEKKKQQPKEDKAKAQPAKEKTKEAKEDGSKKVKTASGLIIEDKDVGTGPQAKAGQRVGMRYVGRLTNGKQFDANQKGKPFSFKLGKGEVIAGWDEGVKGMQVGGTRRLTIPPQLAYGKKGAPPDIPPNSTLIFDVRLVEIK